MTLTPRDRVYLTLLGLADAQGRIEQFARTEALDYAETPSAEFERILDELIAIGDLQELPRNGRAARRFLVASTQRRREALTLIARRRDFVQMVAAERARLEPGRATLTGTVLPAPRIVRAEPMPPVQNCRRWEMTVIVPGFGTIRRCVYVENGEGYVMAPGVKRGAEWEKVIEWTADFARSLRDAARAHVGQKDAIAG
jgi:hypothetical protein